MIDHVRTVLPGPERREWKSRDQQRDRIAAEYRQLAGLSLTTVQACRLFRVNADQFDRIVRELAEAGVLRVTEDERLVRVDVT